MSVMDKDFDFDKIGKKTPFRTPEGFFERMQAETMRRVEEEKRKIYVITELGTEVLELELKRIKRLFRTAQEVI